MSPDALILKRIQKARTALLLDHPFFGSLLFRLKGYETRSVKTMATDGISLYYNPDFVSTLNAATLAGTLAHEVMHPALRHHTMLRRLWSETTPADYSWARPNRRHIWAGLYLPGVQREGVGEIAIAVDCSGSVNKRQLRLFEAEVRSILEGQ